MQECLRKKQIVIYLIRKGVAIKSINKEIRDVQTELFTTAFIPVIFQYLLLKRVQVNTKMCQIWEKKLLEMLEHLW